MYSHRIQSATYMWNAQTVRTIDTPSVQRQQTKRTMYTMYNIHYVQCHYVLFTMYLIYCTLYNAHWTYMWTIVHSIMYIDRYIECVHFIVKLHTFALKAPSLIHIIYIWLSLILYTWLLSIKLADKLWPTYFCAVYAQRGINYIINGLVYLIFGIVSPTYIYIAPGLSLRLKSGFCSPWVGLTMRSWT